MLRKIFTPIVLQGGVDRKEYFEGWYFKQASVASDKAIAFIPGISTAKGKEHAFIQVISALPVRTHYFRFPLESFSAQAEPFSVKIGSCTFSEQELLLDLEDEKIKISGRLSFGGFKPLERSLLMPNIMGIFAYLPRMSCNHAVISMSHSVTGELAYGGEKLLFAEDKGYLEKDWGTSFPRRYIWLQANHFPEKSLSMMLSIADVPFGFGAFTGLIANICFAGREYRFATYNGGRIGRIVTTEEGVKLCVSRGKYRLEVEGRATQSGKLRSPLKGEMAETIKEGLGGIIKLSLYEGHQLLVEALSPYAGVEIVNWK